MKDAATWTSRPKATAGCANAVRTFTAANATAQSERSSYSAWNANVRFITVSASAKPGTGAYTKGACETGKQATSINIRESNTKSNQIQTTVYDWRCDDCEFCATCGTKEPVQMLRCKTCTAHTHVGEHMLPCRHALTPQTACTTDKIPYSVVASCEDIRAQCRNTRFWKCMTCAQGECAECEERLDENGLVQCGDCKYAFHEGTSRQTERRMRPDA